MPRTLTTPAAAAELGVRADTLRIWGAEKGAPHDRTAGSRERVLRRWDPEEIRRWVKGRKDVRPLPPAEPATAEDLADELRRRGWRVELTWAGAETPALALDQAQADAELAASVARLAAAVAEDGKMLRAITVAPIPAGRWGEISVPDRWTRWSLNTTGVDLPPGVEIDAKVGAAVTTIVGVDACSLAAPNQEPPVLAASRAEVETLVEILRQHRAAAAPNQEAS